MVRPHVAQRADAEDVVKEVMATLVRECVAASADARLDIKVAFNTCVLEWGPLNGTIRPVVLMHDDTPKASFLARPLDECASSLIHLSFGRFSDTTAIRTRSCLIDLCISLCAGNVATNCISGCSLSLCCLSEDSPP